MKRLARTITRELARTRRGRDAAPPESPRGRAAAPAPEATAVHSVQRGVPLDDAIVAQTRALLRAGDVRGAQSFAESLRAQPGTESLGRVLCGIVAHHRGYLDLAWHRLEGLPRTAWARHAAREYARCGLKVSPDQALTEIEALAKESPDYVQVDAWFAVVGPVLALGRTDVARQIIALLDELALDDPEGSEGLSRRIEGLRPWLEADPDASVGPRREGTRFAVLDYKRPGTLEGSKNIGDHIQSIAALGHLVRHTGVRLQGEPELVDLLTHMRERTRPGLRLDQIDAEVEVLTVQRDASELQVVPDGTWTLCFGWYMHPIFGFRYGFPLNRALRPVFVSFHCNERGLLTDSAIEYLKQYGPVGCRDWTTVYLLLSMGVPAFFSGCLTTTISTVFPDRLEQAPPSGSVAYVDVRPAGVPKGAAQFQHAEQEVRSRSFAANCHVALERLDTYRRDYARVVTSRLHCYLPLRSLDVPVDFVPDNRSDVRFNGLINITNSDFDQIRDGILGKLEQVFGSILSGSTEEEVYTLWRDITAPDVALARARAAAGAEPSVDGGPVTDQVRKLASTAVTRSATAPADQGAVVHCAVETRKGDAPRLRALVRSLTRHTARPLHLWVLAGAPSSRLQDELATAFPQHSFTWLETAGLGKDLRTVTGERPSPLARLVVADLLPDVDRLVVLPVEAVVTADIGALADLDLEGHAFAAPTVTHTAQSSGFGVLHRAAARLKDRTEPAAALLRDAYARHAFDFDSFGTEVMVLDLAKMRSEGFVQSAVSLSLGYAMAAREVLHYLAGPNRSEIPADWAYVPTQGPERGAGLTHWVGETKPWDDLFTPDQEVWQAYAGR